MSSFGSLYHTHAHNQDQSTEPQFQRNSNASQKQEFINFRKKFGGNSTSSQPSAQRRVPPQRQPTVKSTSQATTTLHRRLVLHTYCTLHSTTHQAHSPIASVCHPFRLCIRQGTPQEGEGEVFKINNWFRLASARRFHVAWLIGAPSISQTLNFRARTQQPRLIISQSSWLCNAQGLKRLGVWKFTMLTMTTTTAGCLLHQHAVQPLHLLCALHSYTLR
jgi:hypothetical protein